MIDSNPSTTDDVIDTIRVLIVADNPTLTTRIRDSLEAIADHFVIETATSVTKALEHLNPDTESRNKSESDSVPGTDCIVSSYEMTPVDGIEFLEAVRDQYPNVPFILSLEEDSNTVVSDAITAEVTDCHRRTDNPGGYELLAHRITTAVNNTRTKKEKIPHQSQEQFKLAVEAANLGVWHLDIEADDHTVNEQWAEMLGYTVDEIDHHTDAWEDRIHPDDRSNVTAAQQAHINGDTPYYDVEHRLRTAEGDWKWIRSIGRIIERDTDRTPLRSVGIHLDIDEQKQREEELRETKEELEQNKQALEQKNSKLERLASVVSHDIRNPLNVIQGRVQLARGDNDVGDHLDVIESNVRRIDEIVENMLTITRDTESRKTGLVDLSDAVQRAWDHVNTKEVTLEATEIDQVTIEGDRGRLIQLFENFFDNAVEHGGNITTVRIGPVTDDEGNCQGFFVADDGAGIPEEIQEAILEDGYTTSEEGTGLGLTIITTIIEEHGWQMVVTDSERGGARFEIVGIGSSE